MKWLIALCIILVTLVLLLFGLTLFFFSYAIRSKPLPDEKRILASLKKRTNPKYYDRIEKGAIQFQNADKKDMYITSRDGLLLHGTLWEQPDRDNVRGTAILVHGWRSCPLIDFSASWTHYCELGFDILFIDQRAHGKSQGKYICFGTKERFDTVDWIKAVNKRYGESRKVILCGVSMGCSTVLMAIGEDDLPNNVVGAIADCGFTSAWDEFSYILRHSYHLPKFPLLYTTDLMSRAVAKFAFREYSTEEALKKTKIPILMFHGLADDFVPPVHSRRSAAACASECELIEVEGAGHGMSYLVDHNRAKEKVNAFFDRILPVKKIL